MRRGGSAGVGGEGGGGGTFARPSPTVGRLLLGLEAPFSVFFDFFFECVFGGGPVVFFLFCAVSGVAWGVTFGGVFEKYAFF